MRHRAIVVSFVMFALFAGPAAAGELKVLLGSIDLDGGKVFDVDRVTGAVTELSPGSSGTDNHLGQTFDTAFAPDGRLIVSQHLPGGVYLSLRGSGRLVRYDPHTGATRDVASGVYATGLAVDARGRILAATQVSLLRIDPGTGAEEMLVWWEDLGMLIWDVAVNENGILYLAMYDDPRATRPMI
jgi:hypothetical protein